METATEQLKKFEIKIQSLGDQDLVQTLQKLLEREKRVGDAILLALKEIRNRRIYAAMGYSSPFEMLVKHFHLSESSSYTRLQALKLMDTIPEIQADLASGDLSLSNAALVQGFIQRSEKENDQPLTLEEKKEVVELVKKKSSRDAKAELAKKDPVVALPPQKEKPLALNHTQLQITVDAKTMETLGEVKNLLSHTIPDGNLKEVLNYMLNLTVHTLKKRKGQDTLKETKNSFCENKSNLVTSNSNQASFINKTSATLTNSGTDVKDITNDLSQTPQPTQSSSLNHPSTKSKPLDHQSTLLTPSIPISSKPTRFISQLTKRKVFQRSGGCCEYISENGRRCNSKHRLEWDHIIPWSQGGGNDETSLRVYCRTHNQYRTKETHGFWYK